MNEWMNELEHKTKWPLSAQFVLFLVIVTLHEWQTYKKKWFNTAGNVSTVELSHTLSHREEKNADMFYSFFFNPDFNGGWVENSAQKKTLHNFL
jgi:hypothetical protein